VAEVQTWGAAGIAHSTRHKVAFRLLPFLFVLYIVNYLDRTSVAYAAIGMARDLHFSDRVLLGWGPGIFFIGYVALQIPGALLVERWSARRVISLTMIIWGAMTVLTALVQTPAQLYAARFILGSAEAAFFPGVIVYLSHWFVRDDRAKATSNFMAAIPVSFVLGSPLAGLLLGYRFFGISGWRWLFVCEGAPAIIFGAIAYFYLTDLPRQAGWLGPEQQQSLEQRLEAEKSTKVHAISVGRALRSPIVLLLSAICFLNYFGYYSFLFALPTMLKRMSGLSDLNVGLLGAVPYAALFFAFLINGWHSDKVAERRWHCAVPCMIGTIGLLGLAAQPKSVAPIMLCVTLVTLGMAYLPALWAVPTEVMGASAAAAAVGLVNAVGNAAGFGGPYAFAYLNTHAGSFRPGLILLALTAFAAALLVLALPKRKLNSVA
jgi:ACS family tartrate transporter-like MFS transporter